MLLSFQFVNTNVFVSFEDAQKANLNHCDLCYCYSKSDLCLSPLKDTRVYGYIFFSNFRCLDTVCDKPVSQCKKWGSEKYSVSDHCNATDKGANSYYYKQLRGQEKQLSSITPSPHSGRVEISQHHGDYDDDDSDDMRSRILDEAFRRVTGDYSNRSDPNPTQRGPWAPTLGASKNKSGVLKGLLTQCRRCSYFNKFDHLNYTKVLSNKEKAYTTGPQDYCHACGRVASEKDFGKIQLEKFNPSIGDVCLGEKIIPFTIKAHDPRKFRDAGKYWMRNAGKPGWEYDETEMEEDFFRHHIGKNPTLRSILTAVPVRDEVPDFTGDLRKGTMYPSKKAPGITESGALLLENKADLSLLLELFHFRNSIFVNTSDVFVGVETHAEWNKDTRRGVSFQL